MYKAFNILGSVYCLSKASAVQANPWMNTTAGLVEFPQAAAQILVPSAEVTNWPGEISIDIGV